ncbi:MAG TPA: SEC-C metal-binding domain-containing protein [Conexibacter sp.]|nr:SEC-C metal-binding domain-containing protein [Conexibacter sp.]
MAAPEEKNGSAMEVFQFTDTGTRKDDSRPKFDRMLTMLGEPQDAPRGVIVASLYNLFRSRRDRQRVDALVRDGRLHVISTREDFSTAEGEGLGRYEQFADLVTLAFEGEWPGLMATTRHGIADEFVDSSLARWVEAWCKAEQESEPALQDVRERLHALVNRWDINERIEPLIAPFLEVADQHEPVEVPVRLRALALLGVRNSALEDLHLADVILQDDWSMLTQAAAHALSRIADAPPDVDPGLVDPFEGVLEVNPTATSAFVALAGLSPGEEVSWAQPERELPEVPTGDVAQRMLPGGYEVRHAMDAGISIRLAEIMRQRAEDKGVLVAPSLKHLSRNPSTLFRVVDILLAHGATIATANVLLAPDRIVRREDVTDYNSEDIRWTGLPGMPADLRMRVGRNDPCPCGSGKKYKRCCGS